ncbi:MAG: hypothetical protein IJB65_06495 [Clostridia bacterium]|nr:hypothetical protein [Clostridia bacterium]
MKRKALVYFMAALLSLSTALSACGGDEAEGSSVAKDNSSSVVESSEAESSEASSESSEDSSVLESSEDSTSSEDSEVSESSEDVSESEEESSELESSEESVVIESSEESVAVESSDETAESDEDLPEETEYAVTVKAPDGNPCTSGVVVKFMQNGEQVSMQVPNSNGVASKMLPTGEYTVELAFTGDEYFYAQTDLTLDGHDNTLTIDLCNSLSGEPFVLYVAGDEFNAYDVSAGQTLVSLSAGMNYFVFTPTVAGTYAFKPSAANAQIGYHGSPHFVQSNNVGDVINNTLTVSVSASGISTAGAGTTQLVIGINVAEATENCVLTITRTGEAQPTIEDIPWDIYQTTASLSPYTAPTGANLVNFDLKAATAYNLVYNENDGFYHLNSADGPLVLVRLTEDPEYMACFKTILDRSGVNKYTFDENGACIKKESFDSCLLEYIECADENSGVYPLTKDLEHIIKERGDYVGWWNTDSSGYIFRDRNGNPDLNINVENAWLFMCCYIG